MAKQTLSVTLEASTISDLKKLSTDECRTTSNMLEYIVKQYILQKRIEAHEKNVREKNARAALFGEQVKVVPYSETQKGLKKNVFIDENDLAYLKKRWG